MESLPRLAKLVENTRDVPNIKKWLKERPADGLFIKLTYFNLRGRAESARLVLAYAGAKYHDNRITGVGTKYKRNIFKDIFHFFRG